MGTMEISEFRADLVCFLRLFFQTINAETIMKVLLVNGSPHKQGCTHTALTEVARVLEQEGVETEIFWLGAKPVAGCIGCKSCKETGHCFMKDDVVAAFVEKAREADGFVFGSPVHYAAPSGAIVSFMDRLFYSAGPMFWQKPAAGIVSCRRGGATAAFEQLNKYFSICGMPVVSSQYWNMVHGNTPEEVLQDKEGMQIMRTLGRNMAWLLKCIEAGTQAGIAKPAREPWTPTNFIR